MNWIDTVLIGIYFLLVIGIAWKSSRRISKQGYLIAERKLGVFDTIATITASKIATGVITAYVALVYVFGIGAIWVFVGYCTGYILFYFFARRIRALSEQEKFFTLADYFHSKYSKSVGHLAGLLCFAFYFSAILIQFIGGSKILSVITGLSYNVSLLVVGIVIFLYLYIGGFSAMVKTDTLQFFAMLILLGVITIFLQQNFVFVPEDWNLLSVSAKDLIAFFLAGLLTPLATVDLYQRVYAAKDKRTMKKGVLFAALCFLILGTLISFLAILTKAHVPAGIDPDIVLVEGFVRLLPSGLIGIGAITLFAIIMSSADTYLFTSASVFTHDFYGRLKLRKEKELVRFLKKSIFGFSILGVALSLLIPNLVQITHLLMGVVVILALSILATWIKPAVRPSSLFLGMLAGVLGIAVHAILKGIEPSTSLSGLLLTLITILVLEVSFWIKNILQRKYFSKS